MRRNRIFRDRRHPFEVFDDVELYNKFRFRRHDIIALTDEVGETLELATRLGTVPPLLQVCVALRFYASGSFQDVCGELIGIHQSTSCRVSRIKLIDANYILPVKYQVLDLKNSFCALSCCQPSF